MAGERFSLAKPQAPPQFLLLALTQPLLAPQVFGFAHTVWHGQLWWEEQVVFFQCGKILKNSEKIQNFFR